MTMTNSTGALLLSLRRTSHALRPSHQGQALVEFVIVMPILVLMTLGAGILMLAAHQTHLLSDAVAQTAMYKLDFANSAQGVSMETLQNDMSQGDLKASFSPGSPVDSVTVVDSDPYTSLVIGKREFKPPSLFMPAFTVGSIQVINRNLLLPAQNGSAVIHSTEPWAPGL